MKSIYLDVLENTTKMQGKDLLVAPANRCNLNHTHPILRFFGPTACDGNLTKTCDKNFPENEQLQQKLMLGEDE